MKNHFKVTLPLAVLITLIAIIYQRSTGPTYPKKFHLGMGAGSVQVKLPRSHGGETDCPIILPKLDKESSATLFYKRFPTNDEWSSVEMIDKNNSLSAALPHQPPAGKMSYYINLKSGFGERFLGNKKAPIIIRFKAHVPTYILAPHVFFMFISMLLIVVAAGEAYFKTKSYRTFCFIATFSVVFGGLVLGPIVQKFAFGVYWAGFPFDWDLTDNKLLISASSCLLASFLNLKKQRPKLVIFAAIVLMGMYCIPHSTMGSQFNYEKNSMEYK